MVGEKVLVLEETNFNQVLSESKLPVLVDFWAVWCGPCKMLSPVVENVADELAGKITVGKLNVDENQAIAGNFKISSIPTLLLFKNGEEIDRSIGYKTKEELGRWLSKYL